MCTIFMQRESTLKLTLVFKLYIFGEPVCLFSLFMVWILQVYAKLHTACLRSEYFISFSGYLASGVLQPSASGV